MMTALLPFGITHSQAQVKSLWVARAFAHYHVVAGVSMLLCCSIATPGGFWGLVACLKTWTPLRAALHSSIGEQGANWGGGAEGVGGALNQHGYLSLASTLPHCSMLTCPMSGGGIFRLALTTQKLTNDSWRWAAVYLCDLKPCHTACNQSPR